MNTEDFNTGFEEFRNIFMRKDTDCCSKKHKKKIGWKNHPIRPYISHGLLQCINEKNKLWTNHVNDPSIATLEKYIEYINASDQFYVKLGEFISLETSLKVGMIRGRY